MADDASIFRVQESVGVLSRFVSDFGWGGGSTFDKKIASRTALHESMMVEYSRLLTEIS